MNHLVKCLVNDDGEEVSLEDQVWCATTHINGDPAVLCTGNFTTYSCGGNENTEYIFKSVKRGGITCRDCLAILREYNGYKL